MAYSLSFPYQRYRVRIELDDSGLLLLVNDCVRKQRRGGADEVLFVWTNLELEWEEHHFLEVRCFPATDERGRRLELLLNRERYLTRWLG